MNHLIICFLCAAALALAQGTFTAASCNRSDVNAVINGPTHTAVDGDTILIPAGSCTWTTAVTVPSNMGISIIGAGQSSTTITSNVVGGNLFVMRPTFGNSTSRISSMTLQPQAAADLEAPIMIIGICTASGCPNIRIDRITFPTSWVDATISAASVVIATGVFGVLHHNTVGDTFTATTGIALANVNHPAWLGVGQFGDKSWEQATSLGTEQAIYIEDNTFNYAFGTDTDTSDAYERIGGGRIVCRFNTFDNVTLAGACVNHGTETTGRPRGGRQIESYGNTLTCNNTSSGCANGFGFRSGVGLVFQNTFNVGVGAWYNNYARLNTQRTVRPTIWGLCNGTGPFDVNEGSTVAFTGTIASTTATTLTVSDTPWTAGAYNFSSSSPGSIYYYAYDDVSGEIGGISSNTNNTLTFSWKYSGLSSTLGGGTFGVGNAFRIYGVTLHQAGTHTGSTGASVLTDSTKGWTTNQWVSSGNAYSVLNVANGNTYQIGANTATTLTAHSAPFPDWTWTNGNAYAILRASRCFDQPASSGGGLMSGTVPVPAATTQTVDPTYEFKNSGATPTQATIDSDSLNVIANRDFYGANASFAGTSGTGFGTLAARPSTCTPRVGYWVTDEAEWNSLQAGADGRLYICTATNTWTLSYTPYTYPHPLQGAVISTRVGGSGQLSGSSRVQ